MRHGKKVNHLGRKSAHRHALLSNMASSLILNKRITTTVAKAKGNLLGRTESARRVGSAAYPAGTALPPAEALEEARIWLRTLPWEEASRRLAALDPAAATRLRGAVVQVGTGSANGAGAANGAAGTDGATPPPPFASPASWAGFVLIGAHR